MNNKPSIEEGVENLLSNCIGAKSGESLVIIYEPDHDDYYSPTLAPAVAQHAKEFGLDVSITGVPFLEEVTGLPPQVRRAFETANHTVFLARIGDQVRFSALAGVGTKTMCYALDEASFRSEFCSAHYQFFIELKRLINAALWRSEKITITCNSGTRLVGSAGPDPGDDDINDVTVKRFPMTVCRPVPGVLFSGEVALTRWLCPTGSKFYSPSSVLLDRTVIATVENGRITNFEGDAADVRRINNHYDYVAGKYALDRDVIHSWHAGIHPQNGYQGLATDNLMRWSGSAFGNPRYLHIHTCGDYAPGEICVSVFDPTISVDNGDLWRDGRLVFAETPAVQSLMNDYPGIREIFESPQREFGL